MTGINDMTQLLLVPVDATTLFDALTEGGESTTTTTLERPGERPTVLVDDLPAMEVVEDHAGWCLVAVGPILEDIPALRAFVEGREMPKTVVELELAADHVGDMLEHMGALPACRSKGRWRPVLDEDRPMWSQHLVDCNTQKLRYEAQAARTAANDDAAIAKAA